MIIRGKFLFSVVSITCLFCRLDTAFAITGNQWMQMDTNNRAAYVMGVFDAWATEVSLCRESKSKHRWWWPWGSKDQACDYESVVSCSEQRPYSQTFAIVDNIWKIIPRAGNITWLVKSSWLSANLADKKPIHDLLTWLNSFTVCSFESTINPANRITYSSNKAMCHCKGLILSALICSRPLA